MIKRSGADGFELCLDVQTDFVRDYIAALMLDEFKVMPKNSDKNALVYVDCDKLLKGLWLVDPDGGFYDGIPQRFIRSSHYARGVFLGCGSMSAPQADGARSQKSGGYHLEFSFGSDAFADGFSELLRLYGIEAHKAPRAERSVMYVKDSEAVSDCLALIGAEKTVIKLNEAVATFAVKRDVVRRVNCEMANMQRTLDAVEELSHALDVIERAHGKAYLDHKLIAAAKARLEDANAPLSEVAEKLGISKSGLKHRLDRILELARDVGAAEE